ncbi:TPA: DUF2591 domain-containing protein [Morganella morganii]|nr:DUF2591 domain-containing protein [Morganella morganii]
MNKYRDKSDFEINKAVAVSLGYTAEYENESVTVFRNNNGGMPLVVSLTADSPDNFDPCNNPADAMPIVIENGISMVRVNNEWSARQFNNHCIEVNDSNYFRAAMICFLMMKEAENEKS